MGWDVGQLSEGSSYFHWAVCALLLQVLTIAECKIRDWYEDRKVIVRSARLRRFYSESYVTRIWSYSSVVQGPAFGADGSALFKGLE